MDFSNLIVIPLAAVITAAWMIFAALLKRKPTFRGPFLLSYVLAMLLMQPWLVASWQEFGMLAVMLVMTAISVAAGCLLGALPAMAAIALVRRLARHQR